MGDLASMMSGMSGESWAAMSPEQQKWKVVGDMLKRNNPQFGNLFDALSQSGMKREGQTQTNPYQAPVAQAPEIPTMQAMQPERPPVSFAPKREYEGNPFAQRRY